MNNPFLTVTTYTEKFGGIILTQTTTQPPSYEGWKRKTAFFLTGQTVSLFGSSLVQFAIIWYITLSTQSGVMMTISSICGFLPQIAVSLFAGVWADRYNRKKLIIYSDAMTAASTLLLAILFLSGYDSLWTIFVVSAIRSFGAGIQTPAVNAVIPQLVPPEKLMRVNGINGSLQSMIMLLSPAASGALMSALPLGPVFFVDVATAAIAITIMIFLKIPLHHKALEKIKGGYFTDLKQGLSYVRRSSFIKELLVAFALFSFFAVPAAMLTPLQVSRTFGNEVWRLSATEMLFSGGAVLGGIVISIWGGFRNRTNTVFLGCVGFGVCTVFLGLIGNFPLYLAVMGVTGLFMPLLNTAVMVILQEKVHGDMQGRIFSLIQIVGSSTIPLGMVLFGPLADTISVEILLWSTGAVLLVLSVCLLFSKQLRQAGEPAVSPAQKDE